MTINKRLLLSRILQATLSLALGLSLGVIVTTLLK